MGTPTKTAADKIGEVTDVVESLRGDIAMLFALKKVDELVALKSALRTLRCVLSIDLDDNLSIVGTFDALADMAKAKTFGPEVAEIGRVVPKRVYTKTAKTEAPAKTDDSEATEQEDSADESAESETPAAE
jgi:hypothetical protein